MLSRLLKSARLLVRPRVRELVPPTPERLALDLLRPARGPKLPPVHLHAMRGGTKLALGINNEGIYQHAWGPKWPPIHTW